jgi:hypothetical protein
VRLDLAGMRAITDALLAVDELLDPAVRGQVLLLLPRDIAAGVPVADDARVQVLNWVRACARFPHGRDALIEALEMVAPTGTPEVRRAVETIKAHWPAG